MFVETYGSFVCREVQRSIFGRLFNLLYPEQRLLFEKEGGMRISALPSWET
jgi:hypothetical protein